MRCLPARARARTPRGSAARPAARADAGARGSRRACLRSRPRPCRAGRRRRGGSRRSARVTADARALEHPVGDVDGDNAVEALGEHAGHASRAAADLDAGASARIGAEPPEQALELGSRGRRIAHELVDAVGRGGRVPRRPHLVPGHRQRVRLRLADGRSHRAAGRPVHAVALGAPRGRRDADVPRRRLLGNARGGRQARARVRAAVSGRPRARRRRERRGLRAAALLPRGRRRPLGVSPPLPRRPRCSAARRAISPGCGPCASPPSPTRCCGRSAAS